MMAISLSDNGLRLSADNLKQNIKAANESIEIVECFI